MSMAAMLIPRTIRHNSRTIGLYRPRTLVLTPAEARTHRAVIHVSKRKMEKPRRCRSACPSHDLASSIIQQELFMRNFLLSTVTVVMAGAAFAAPVRSAELPKGAAHNIVLVHGAFVDQTSWKPVADILTKKGYNVTLVENPLTSLTADVDATKQALAKQNGKTVLVGHSWGGVVITEAGNDPKVSALVYVSAFAPDVGQSLATLANGGPPTEGTKAIHPDDKGNLYIDQAAFPSV